MVALEETAKEAFARRLNAALDEIDGCPKGRGRPAWLHDRFVKVAKKRVSHEITRKWLLGQAIAKDDNLLLLSRVARVSPAWLQAEFGSMHDGTDISAASTEMFSIWSELGDAVREEVLDYARYKARGSGQGDKQPPSTNGHGTAKAR